MSAVQALETFTNQGGANQAGEIRNVLNQIIMESKEVRRFDNLQTILNADISAGALSAGQVVWYPEIDSTGSWGSGTAVNLQRSLSGGFAVISKVHGEDEQVGGLVYSAGEYGISFKGKRYNVAPIERSLRYPLARYGIPCIPELTDWEDDFGTLATYFGGQGWGTLVGPGELTVAKTVELKNASMADMPIFQAKANFFAAGYACAAVTITPGSPGVLTLASGTLPVNKPIMFASTGFMGGNIALRTAYYVRNPSGSNFEIATAPDGPSLTLGTTQAYGTHYIFYATESDVALPSQSGISTFDHIRWDGTMERLGIAVKGCPNIENTDWCDQTIQVKGDGDFDKSADVWNTPATCIGVAHGENDSAFAKFHYKVSNCATGVLFNSTAEKHDVFIEADECRWAAWEGPNSSHDSLTIHLNGQDNQGGFGQDDGADGTLTIDLQLENWSPWSRDTSVFSEDNSCPAMILRPGKGVTVTGSMRGMNDTFNIAVLADTNANGTSRRAWADTVHFREFRYYKGYGIPLLARNVRHLLGSFAIIKADNSNLNNVEDAIDTPTVVFGRVISCDLKVSGQSDAKYGFEIGYKNTAANPYGMGPKADERTYYPLNVDFEEISIVDGSGASYYDAQDVIFPNRGIDPTKIQGRIIKADGCSFKFKGKGAIEVLADVTNCYAEVGHVMTRVGGGGEQFPITIDGSATCDVVLPDGSTTGLKINGVVQ